jgi:hypothetical protein
MRNRCDSLKRSYFALAQFALALSFTLRLPNISLNLPQKACVQGSRALCSANKRGDCINRELLILEVRLVLWHVGGYVSVFHGLF